MVELYHSMEMLELYNQIYRLQIRISLRQILDESDDATRKDLLEKIALVREKSGYGTEVTDRDIADMIWKYCMSQVRANL